MFCPNCGNQIEDESKFCGFCGYNFAAEEAAPEPEQPQQFEQPQYEQPQPQQYEQPAAYVPPVRPAPDVPAQQPGYQAPAAVKTGPNPVLVFILTFVLLGSIVASVMLFWKPGFLVNKDEDSSSQSSKSKSSKADDDDDDSSKEESVTARSTETAAPVSSSVPDVTEPPETVTETETVTEPPESVIDTDTETEPTQKPEPPAGKHDEALAVAAKYSTTERPTLEDFVWTVGQYDYIAEMPEGAKRITDPYELSGGWKCFIYYDLSSGIQMRELNSVNIAVADDETITLTIDWYKAYEGDEYIDETDMDDEDFVGKLNNGKLVANGVATLTINDFWQSDEFKDGQYGSGDIYVGEGSKVLFVLMRP
ncbi:MAG: zinc ribbon domain-containing protein [Ruminococcus sp.]|nr:zinc ribbon domain-containing protein [Ruminococcus sp.]